MKTTKHYPVFLANFMGPSPFGESDKSSGVFSKPQTHISLCNRLTPSFRAPIDAQKQSRPRIYLGIYYFRIGTQI